MSEFKPVTAPEDLDLLDSDEIVAGYRAGLRGEPDQASTMGRGWWHGWRNGMTDSRRAPLDDAQHQLCRAMMARGDRLFGGVTH